MKKRIFKGKQKKNPPVIILEFDCGGGLDPKMSEVEEFILRGFKKKKPKLTKDAYWVDALWVGDKRFWKVKVSNDVVYVVVDEFLSMFTKKCRGAKERKKYLELKDIDGRLSRLVLPKNFKVKTDWANKIKFEDEAIVLYGGPGYGKRYEYGTLEEIIEKKPFLGRRGACSAV